MLRETISVMRDLPRLHEIASVLIRYGWGDLVRVLGLARMLERAGKLLHWHTSDDIAQLDLPVRIRLAMTELGPTFVKLGQILATRVDVFPPGWIAEFEQLHSQVPPVPFELLRPLLEAKYGRPLEEVFDGLETTPFAAAYCSSKAALHSLTDALRMELAPFGIHVVSIQPGGVRSSFGAHAEAALRLPADSIYRKVEAGIRARAQAGQQGATPAEDFVKPVVEALLEI